MSAVSTSKEFFHIASEGSISVLDFICSQHFQTLISWFQLASEGTNFNALAFKWYQQCQLPKHCLKKRQKVPFSHFAFKFYSAVPTSKSSIQIASEATIMRSCFQNITSTSKLPNYCFKLRQRAPFYVLDFKILSAVSTSKSSIQIA